VDQSGLSFDGDVASQWFPGAGRNAEDEQFLAGLRSGVEVAGLVDVTPDGTTLLVWETALVVLVEIPCLQDAEARPTLEIVWSLEPDPTLMCGCETYGYVADSYDAMDLAGVERTPSALGRHASGWFAAQLRRPVEELVWSTWRGERSLVRFADDGEPIWWDSGAWRRQERRPDRVVDRRPPRRGGRTVPT
jgi:hypothetical protein